MFAVTTGKGFQLTFSNGWTVSVQFGIHNYCDNRFSQPEEPGGEYAGPCGSAEVAVIKPDGNLYNFHGDSVLAHLDADEVAAVIRNVEAITPAQDEYLQFRPDNWTNNPDPIGLFKPSANFAR